MTRWERSESRTGGHGASWAGFLDELAAWWLAEVTRTDAVRAAGRRAAHAFVRVSGVDPGADGGGAVLTVPSSAEGVARATGTNRADLVRGLAELRAAGLIVERGGVLVLGTGDR